MKSAIKRISGALSRAAAKISGADAAKRRAARPRGNPQHRGIRAAQMEGIRTSVGGTNVGGLG